MHVRIAWEIYNHQQKAKAEAKNGLAAVASAAAPTKPLHTSATSSATSSPLDILSKSQRPPGQDYSGKRPGPPTDLLGSAPALYSGGSAAAAAAAAAAALPPSAAAPYDLMSRSHYAAAAAAASTSYYPPSALGNYHHFVIM